MTAPPPPLPSPEPLRGPVVPAWDWLRRNRHVTVPMAVPPAFLAAGAVLASTPGAGPGTAIGSGVFAATLCGMAHHKWDRAAEQWYARLSALAAAGWLSATAFAGLGAPELIATAPLSLAWGIPWYAHKRTRRHSAKVTDQWRGWWLYYARNWGLHGSHVLDVTTAGVIDTLTVQLHAGHQTLASVREILPRLESALQGHVAPGMTRCEANGRRGDQVLVRLKRANPHDVEVVWDSSLAPASITGVMPLGKDESGEWVTVPCMALNWFLIGALGGGKSNELSVMLASITGCPDARVWLIDRKGGKAARPWLGAIDWVATSVEESRLMLRTLVDEVRARALHGYDGNEEMTPSPEVPAIFLVIDEAHNIVSNTADKVSQDLLADVASECRSSAVRVIVCTQYGALHESVGTEQIRGNLKNRICFKVAEKAHGQFALDDWATLDASRLDNPGEFYYRLEQDTASAPARGPHMPHPFAREIAARNAVVERPPLRLYAGEHQAGYDARWDRLPAEFRRANLTAVPASPEVPVTPAPPPWQDALDRIEAEAASVPDLPAPPPVDDALLRRSVEGRMRLWARLLQDAPAGGVEPKTLNAGSGMSNSWTHLKLPRLASLGYVTKIGKGRYGPVAGQDVWEGLEKIREADDRLAELAGVG